MLSDCSGTRKENLEHDGTSLKEDATVSKGRNYVVKLTVKP
jgi:hypothetical protein